ncbi:MAG: hypothetical protein ACTTJO_01900 [Metamycoplasmataceae bacterium]
MAKYLAYNEKTYQKFLNDKDQHKNCDEDDLRYYKTKENDYNMSIFCK